MSKLCHLPTRVFNVLVGSAIGLCTGAEAMRTAPPMAGLKERVKVLKEEKAKVQASSAKYRGKYKDLKKENRGW